MCRESDLTQLWIKWVESELSQVGKFGFELSRSCQVSKFGIWVESELSHLDCHMSQSRVIPKKWVEHNPGPYCGQQLVAVSGWHRFFSSWELPDVLTLHDLVAWQGTLRRLSGSEVVLAKDSLAGDRRDSLSTPHRLSLSSCGRAPRAAPRNTRERQTDISAWWYEHQCPQHTGLRHQALRNNTFGTQPDPTRPSTNTPTAHPNSFRPHYHKYPVLPRRGSQHPRRRSPADCGQLVSIGRLRKLPAERAARSWGRADG